MNSRKMRTTRCLPYMGVLVQGVLCPGDLCPEVLCPEGSLSKGVSVQRDLCQRGSLSGGSLSGGLCPGDLCLGVSVRDIPPMDKETWDQRQRPPGMSIGPGTETTRRNMK